MAKSPDIDFVFFDVGNVLTRFRGGYSLLAEQLEKSVDEIRTVFDEYNHPCVSGQWTLVQASRKYAERFGIRGPFNVEKDVWSKVREPVVPFHRVLVETKRAGYRVGLISNAGYGTFEYAVITGAVPRIRYDAVVLSCEEHVLKPQREMWALSERKAGTSGGRILLVEDSLENFGGAIEYGWQAFLINPEESVSSAAALADVLNLR